jgi:hypothetical protein
MSPKDRILVGESGIAGHADARRLADEAGIRALLVGEARHGGAPGGIRSRSTQVLPRSDLPTSDFAGEQPGSARCSSARA